MRILAAARDLPRDVRRLGWISFLLDVASEMTYPLIPLFLTAVLGAPAAALGAVEGVALAVASVATAFAGWHSDRIRRRVPFVRWGYGIAVAAKPLLALAHTWTAVLALRALDRVGKGLRTAPRDALLADLAGPAERGAAFGFHRAMDTAGAFVGVLLALGLMALLPESYRLVFGLTAIPGAAAIALTFTLREPRRDARQGDREHRRPGLLAAARELPAGWWRAAGVLWLFSAGSPSEAFLLLRASEVGLEPVQVVLVYALYNLVYMLVAWPAGALSDRIGRPALLGLGWTLFAAVFAGLAALDGLHVVWLIALFGAHMGLTQGVARAWVSERAPAALRGTALGIWHLGHGATLLVASLAAGLLWDAAGAPAAFAYGAAVALLALALLPLARGAAARG